MHVLYAFRDTRQVCPLKWNMCVCVFTVYCFLSSHCMWILHEFRFSILPSFGFVFHVCTVLPTLFKCYFQSRFLFFLFMKKHRAAVTLYFGDIVNETQYTFNNIF